MTAATALAAALLLASIQPLGDCLKVALPQMDAFKKCTAVKARQLESSGESPDDIAIAATDTCVDFKMQFADALAPCLGWDKVNDSRDQLDKAARDIAVRIVVEIRAARHSRK